jgi:hypothetical protein
MELSGLPLGRIGCLPPHHTPCISLHDHAGDNAIAALWQAVEFSYSARKKPPKLNLSH